MSDRLVLNVDPERLKSQDAGDLAHSGVFVRARFGQSYDAYEIEVLDKESLLAWLKSRGGDNPWAENTVCILLGHK